MYNSTLASLGLFTACFAILPASAGEIGNNSADVAKNLSVALKWVTGDLDSYGNAPVSYSGAPITFKTTHHVAKVSGLAKAQL